jgi:hypothetical protein
MTEKITRELDALTEAGKLTGKPSFGYDVAGEKYDKRLVPNQLGITYIPLIYQHVIDGWSGKRIAAWLNEEGVSRENTAWWQNSIGQVIRNPVYKGFRCKQEIIVPDEIEIMIDGRVTRQPYTSAVPAKKIVRYRYGAKWREYPRWQFGKVIHKCPALVTAAVWKKANEALENRAHRGYIDPENCAMLSEVLFCPNCVAAGAPMYRLKAGRASSTGTEYAYYRCAGKGGGRESCKNMVRLAAADEAVCQIIATYFDVEIMEHRIVYGNEAEIANRLEEIQFELAQLPRKGLPWAEEDAERAVLRAEYERVAATPVTEDTVELTGTGQTYLQVWEGLSVHQRGHWLAEEGFRVYARGTEVRVVNGNRTGVAAIPAIPSRRRRAA